VGGGFNGGVTVRFSCLGLLLIVLCGCTLGNPARVEQCLVALAGLVPGEGRLLIDGISGQDNVITIAYRDEAAGVDGRQVCTFRGAARDIDQLDLLAASLNGEELGAGRLKFLRSHWLVGPGTDAAARRIVRPSTGIVSMPAGPGRYLQSALSALPIASAYVLLALGFALIHGITGRMNIAHGEFATIGAYAGFAGFMAGGSLSALAGLGAGLVLALAASAAAGYFAIRTVFIPLAARQGQMLLVASVGLILIAQEFIRITHAARDVWLPPLLSAPVALTLPPYVVTVTPMQLLIAGASAMITAGILSLIAFTRFGKAWRAVADDPLAARFMGIDPARILAMSSVLSSGLAGTAGVAILFAYGNAGHSMGLMLSIKAMAAALIGGMGTPGGAVLGALVLATIETFWAALFGGTYRDIAVFAIMIGLLTLRPGGLTGASR
jgi:branched-chain amino acid transport system permease protein